MPFFSRGAYRVRIARGARDVRAAQRLRYLTFIRDTGAAPRAEGLDADAFDARCTHFLIELADEGTLVCCFRIMPLDGGHELPRSYAAQHYDLTALQAFPDRMVELGRFCVHPDHRNPHVLRVAWQAITRYVDENGIALMFGCSSFEGVDAREHADSLALLHDRHLAPRRWLPRPKAPNVLRFASLLRGAPDPRRAMLRMPPLLRAYLTLGGWVSDHAVIDEDMNTLHVFTAVEMGKIPERVAKSLRS